MSVYTAMKVAPAQIVAVGQWGTDPGERLAYLMNIKQPTRVVNGNHDVIVYNVNSLDLGGKIFQGEIG